MRVYVSVRVGVCGRVCVRSCADWSWGMVCRCGRVCTFFFFLGFGASSPAGASAFFSSAFGASAFFSAAGAGAPSAGGAAWQALCRCECTFACAYVFTCVGSVSVRVPDEMAGWMRNWCEMCVFVVVCVFECVLVCAGVCVCVPIGRGEWYAGAGECAPSSSS